MNSQRATRWVVAALIVVGAVALGLRLNKRFQVRLMQGDSTWRLTYHVSFRAPKAGSRLRIALPLDGQHSRVFRQDLRYFGLRTERLQPSRSETRELIAVAQREGEVRMTLRFDIHLSLKSRLRPGFPPAALTAEERAQYLRSTRAIQADNPVVAQTLQRLRANPANKADLVEKLFDYCQNQVATGGLDAPSDAAGVLDKGTATPLGRARAMVALCRAAKVPARLVAGFEIRYDGNANTHVWLEVLAGDRWTPYDPDNGFSGEMPHNFLAARRGGAEIIHAPDASGLRAAYTVIPIPPPGGSLGRADRGPLSVFDLTRLPLEMHEILSLILLVPLGALVTSLFRTLVGIRTFGTFTPTLLAMAFCYADWRTGLLIFAVVVSLGLATRTVLDRLKLLMVPRLSIILTLVALCIILAVSSLDYLGVTPGAHAVLLPMVILTMTIERFYVTTEEDGSRFALQLLAGTLAVGACCYSVLRWETIGQLLLIYPEIHFFTMALLILMGRYTGYRLTELWRFRDFSETGATDQRHGSYP